jgi:hypothetical protein
VVPPLTNRARHIFVREALQIRVSKPELRLIGQDTVGVLGGREPDEISRIIFIELIRVDKCQPVSYSIVAPVSED